MALYIIPNMLLHIKAWIILTPLSFSPNTHKHSVSICQHSAVNSLTFNYTLSQVCSSAPLITEYCMLYDTVHVHKCLYIKNSIFHLYWPGWFYPPKPPPPLPHRVFEQNLGPLGDLMECVFYRLWESTPCCECSERGGFASKDSHHLTPGDLLNKLHHAH